MKEIKINVADKVASAISSPVIVCGNSNYKITFIFDSEWGAYQEKTARFTFRRDGIDKYIDVLFSGTSCTAPILTNIERVSIGVYAGDLRTTTGAEIRCKKSILCRGGLKHEQPPEDVYNQILETVGKKLGSEGGTVTGDYFKDGNTFIHEGNLELIEPKINEEINEVLANEKLVETASGSAITIESANAPLQNLKLFGKTEQNGTPTPDNPIELKSVGDSGSFEVGVYGKNFLNLADKTISSASYLFEKASVNIPKGTYCLSLKHNLDTTLGWWFQFYNANGVVVGGTGTKTGKENSALVTLTENAVQVSSYFNGAVTVSEIMLNLGTNPLPYEPCLNKPLTLTDTLRGVGEVVDEIDFAKGVLIQRCVLLKDFAFNYEKTNVNVYRSAKPYPVSYSSGALCNYSSQYRADELDDTHHYIGGSSVWVFLPKTIDTSVASDIEVLGVLETPIETPLTETELNAYRQLMTNSGTTTILSEADMEVDYYINKPNAQAIGNIHSQVNKDYFKLQQAIISTGGN